MKYYFVSYSHTTGFGNIILSASKPFNTNEVKKLVEKNVLIRQTVIISWQELTEEEWKANNEHT